MLGQLKSTHYETANKKVMLFSIAIMPHLHRKKRATCSGLMKTALNNVVLPTLFNVVNNIVQHC